MLRRAVSSSRNGGGTLLYQQCRKLSQRSTDPTISSAVNTMVLRSLKDHYLEVSKMAPPPKVSPPSEFSIVKGALESNGPVLKRQYNNEEINISVMRLANFVGEDVDYDNVADDDDRINQLFVHIDVSKPSKNQTLNFLCGLYPDALGIHSVSLRPKSKSDEPIVFSPNLYTGPLFEALDEKTRDAFHNYIEERGINESLFPFLQAWLYVKDHRNLMRWFQSVGLYVSGREAVKKTDQAKGAANANAPSVARGT